MSKKIVFFEEINSAYDSIIDKYLKNNFIIYFFNIENKYAKKQKTKKHIESGNFINVSSMQFEYALYRQAAFYAHENIDRVFDTYFSNNSSIRNMDELLQFPEIGDMYKKELMLHLEKRYEIELKINEIITRNEILDEVYFIPNTAFKKHISKISLLKNTVEVIPCNNLRKTFNLVLNKATNIFLLFYPVYLFFKKIKGICHNKNRKEFEVGITIDHSKHIFFMNYCNEDYFVDKNELPKEDVLFIDERGKLNIDYYKKCGYNYTCLLDDRETISLNLFWQKMVKRFLPAWFKVVIFAFSEETFIIIVSRKILSDYIKWNIFADNYIIKNYIKKLIPDNISKTHILSQYDIKTWLVNPDSSSNEHHLDWSDTKKNQTIFSFMYYDNMVTHGNVTERFYKKYRNNIKNYIQTGVLYSQVVCELEKGKLESKVVPLIIKKKKLPEKIIGVFDTTFTNVGPAFPDDGIRFGNDILKLIDEFSDVGFIFKAKKEFTETPFITSIYDKLKNHEHCVFFSRFDEYRVSPPEVIAVSDLVISAAYTSTTAEALGAKKKAIYYEPAGRNMGDKYYFNNYPNFVAHNYDELKRLVNYWLYQVKDEEFDTFLNTYVKDEIDPYLDGKAISRMRQLLLETHNKIEHDD